MSIEPRESGERASGFYEAVNFLAVYGTLGFLGLVIVLLVVFAWEDGNQAGLRSLAGAVFPIVMASFVYLFRRNVFEAFGRTGAMAGFVAGAAGGAVVMVILDFLSPGTGIPIAELVVSGCFSILVYASRTLPEAEGLSYYYGVLVGMLLYVILAGFPSIR